MKIFIIPSWYPSANFPSTGIFFKDQALALAKARPQWQVALCLWGSHEPGLLLEVAKPMESLVKIRSKLALEERTHSLIDNCNEFFSPAQTWTRKFKNGNIKGIIKACERNMERFCDRFGKPDIIHAHVAHPGGYIASAIAQNHGIPLVITEHMTPFPMNSYRSDFRKWLLPPLRKADQVLAVSRNLTAKLSSYDIQSELASNFIDDSFFKPSNESPTPFTFIAIGRLESQKNYRLLLESAHALKQQKKPFRLNILGTGSHLKVLEGLMSSLGLDNSVKFLGECSRKEIRHHLHNANVLINTSLHENQPVAMLEALACGLPILTTKWKGADDYITPALGTTTSFDVKEISTKMNALMSAYHPKIEIRKAYEEAYGSKKVIRELELIYSRLLQ